MGSGSGCDGQYLFSQDILGYNTGHVPRHSRIYRNFKKEFDKLHVERVNAYRNLLKTLKIKSLMILRSLLELKIKNTKAF